MKKNLIIKVCGMLIPENRKAVEKLPVDLLGFIFYEQSKRFAGEVSNPDLFETKKLKTGVFVDENAFEIMALAKNIGLDYVQLHGQENPKTCSMLKNQDLKVIKAFNVDENFRFSELEAWEDSVDYFLFDTKSAVPGGSGKKFDWQLLDKYEGNIPFILSGGIGPGDAGRIKKLDHPLFVGIDLNSGFEDAPGVKNPEKLKAFIEEIRN